MRSLLVAAATLVLSCSAPQALRPPSASEIAAAPVPASVSAPGATASTGPALLKRVTILAVADLAYSAAFYREVFGWRVQTQTDTFVAFTLADGTSLGLYQRDGFAKSAGKMPEALAYGAISGTELYLVFDDPSPTLDRLKKRGARVLSEWAPRPWGDEAAYFADPDGNVVAIARMLPEPAPR